MPLYFLAILFIWTTRNPSLPGDWADLLRHLTFTQVFDKEQIFYTIGPTWSLSLEIMFYLALVALGPLAAGACRAAAEQGRAGCGVRRRMRAAVHRADGLDRRRALRVRGAAHRMAGVLRAAGPLRRVRGGHGARGADGRPRRPRTARPEGDIPLRVAPLVALYVLSLLGADPEDFATTFYHPLSAVLWTVLLFATLHVRKPGRWEAWLSARWLTAIGLASYSLFVWHEPIMLGLYEGGLLPPAGQEGFPFAVLIVLAVAVATASYWVIEYPASLLGRLKDHRGSRGTSTRSRPPADRLRHHLRRRSAPCARVSGKILSRW